MIGVPLQVAAVPLLLLFALSSVPRTKADTPADCHYNDVVGQWIFYETARTNSPDDNCQEMDGETVYVRNITLSFPNTATDEFGNYGTWTMVYNQGFEVRVGGRSYFAFSYFEKTANETISYCGRTFNGWSRDYTVRNWACFRGEKVNDPSPKTKKRLLQSKLEVEPYVQDLEFIDAINKAQKSWTAKHYAQFEGLSKLDMYRIGGGHKITKPFNGKKRVRSSLETKLQVSMLPKFYDWRNVSGINYVRPVKNQGNCGSCYAFASIGMIESQLLVHSMGKESIDLSAEDVVGCSTLSQGCDGGFPYLIAGRYTQDVGMVTEQCVPYNISSECNRDRLSCSKVYTTDYQYVGGYYGACNEEEMMVALINSGPLAVGIDVGKDFMQYHSGIYHKITTLQSGKFEPFETTNHAVLLVGYGVSDAGEKYWIIQNSWGTGWGMDGYVLIRRGTDEIGVESMAVQATAYV